MTLSAQLKQAAIEIGFDIAAITSCTAPPHADSLRDWLNDGFSGEMRWMHSDVSKRKEPSRLWDECKSILVAGLNYRQTPPGNSILSDPSRGRIASYAWGRDYHKVMGKRLKTLAGRIRDIAGRNVRCRWYVDTAPLLEKPIASAAQAGFIGKNTLLINPRFGSFVFLGEILLDIELEPDMSPLSGLDCGDCTVCVDRCPTGALNREYILNASRCISYLTIEHHGIIPHELRPLTGNRIFGCDACQTCCPYNTLNKPETGESDFLVSDPNRIAPLLADIIEMDDAGFAERFRGTVVMRIKRHGLARNAAVALGNWGTSEAFDPLAKALKDPEPLVRGHAAWALGRIKMQKVKKELEAAIKSETIEYVKEEIRQALARK